MNLTLLALQTATAAVAHVAAALSCGAAERFRSVRDCEAQLDSLDREVDQRAPEAVAGVSVKEAREVLACSKLVTDLERIGDLVSNVAGRAEAVWKRIEAPDVEDLIRMATILETMLRNTAEALSLRDLRTALTVIRADSEIDRLRNMIFVRHVEDRDGLARESLHVLMMAQALERAGDHAKNLGEEVCHLFSGHTLRHVARSLDQPLEQMYLRWLREQNSGTGTAGQEK